MGRRLLTALILAALGAAAWWIVRADERSSPGLVVHVQVVDAEGKPLADAQIERVFESRRLRVDKQGRAELTGVVLRELDEPSPAALGRAIAVQAPSHALRRPGDARIERREDGAWSMRVTLTPHGILRIYVDETHLGPCKAYPETDDGERSWDPIEGSQVARYGQPASYRVYDDASGDLVVRIEGEPDRDGAVGVATRRVRVPRPAARHVTEKVLVPEEVQVILGQVTVKDGPKPPSLGGHVIITQLAEDDSRIPLAQVRVSEDGRLLARRTGKGRYELEFHLDFFPGTTTLTVLGGATFEVTPVQPALWVTLKHPNTDLSSRTTQIGLWASGEGRAPQGGFLRGNDDSQLALPGAGAYKIRVDVDGTEALPPLRSEVTVDIVSGTLEVAAPFTEVPHGTVVVRMAKGAFGKARGATVYVQAGRTQRRATLIPGLAESVTFKHIPAEPTESRIVWEEEGREDSAAAVHVEPGKTTTVDIEDDRP